MDSVRSALQRWHPAPVINDSINKVWLRGDLQIYDFLCRPADVIMADRTGALSRAAGVELRQGKKKLKGRRLNTVCSGVLLSFRGHGICTGNQKSCKVSELMLVRVRHQLSTERQHDWLFSNTKPFRVNSVASLLVHANVL